MDLWWGIWTAFWLREGGIRAQIFKNSIAQGVVLGMLKLRFDQCITSRLISLLNKRRVVLSLEILSGKLAYIFNQIASSFSLGAPSHSGCGSVRLQGPRWGECLQPRCFESVVWYLRFATQSIQNYNKDKSSWHMDSALQVLVHYNDDFNI